MVAEAQRRPAAANVRYVEAYADATGLPPGSADIATCSQSLHWMEPEPMLAEVARVLRPGGVFAAYDYDLPPAVHPGVDAAFDEFLERGRRLLAFPVRREGQAWRKEEHLERLRASGRFRYVRELVLHGLEDGDAERLCGQALTLGPLAELLRQGVSEEELGLAALRHTAARVFGQRTVALLFGYRVRLAVR